MSISTLALPHKHTIGAPRWLHSLVHFKRKVLGRMILLPCHTYCYPLFRLRYYCCWRFHQRMKEVVVSFKTKCWRLASTQSMVSNILLTIILYLRWDNETNSKTSSLSWTFVGFDLLCNSNCFWYNKRQIAKFIIENKATVFHRHHAPWGQLREAYRTHP